MMRKRFLLALGLLGFIVAAPTLQSCSTPQTFKGFALGQASWRDYENDTRTFLSQHRHFNSTDHAQEVQLNAPVEFKPTHPNGAGILLIHGLGDSPWTFRDLGQALAAQGYLVRAMLLPGHGTKPADMIGVTTELWQKAVAEQAALMQKEVSVFILGGFSTGGNLAIDYAYQHPKLVNGLLLFSPAAQVRTSLIGLAPVVGAFTHWLKKPDEKTAGVGPFKYHTIPLDGIAFLLETN